VKDADQFKSGCAKTADLMRKRMGIRGRGAEQVLGASVSSLPSDLRPVATHLAAAAQKVDHPKLRLTLDFDDLGKKNAALQAHVRAQNRFETLKVRFMDWLTRMVFNMLVLLTILFFLLRWRGLI
jgi:hypothetical protein